MSHNLAALAVCPLCVIIAFVFDCPLFILCALTPIKLVFILLQLILFPEFKSDKDAINPCSIPSFFQTETIIPPPYNSPI